ncbi:tetratricopeptide repeat protein [Lacinutrix sp. C3R15]|uniref:type IX secretion system periplasmic lipoprotein PorW/SprE n=1 Tax=Flavobacteriaceae TaxID=49546 RepID=UPI001C07EF7B|nr:MULTISPECIES: tetratricopeptide repeat protein [Flavobacteriaceae]MBU2938080.1 tetratricopeptide repeat protein [Lacinutrix sp. C3R15]MDO6621394.1 tetratricopeptide repeat protein [Oceanihabitans sp. 1_MG-2023]
MKTSYKIILTLLVLVTLITSCSRKKNTFISRNYHALAARDNVLFNGYNALEEGRENLIQNYTDNYWEILPIERMQVFEEVTLPGQNKNQSFSRAEEKAVKAIQKHGMNIQGKEYNYQIDEAYLLLGKARYFDQRFVPALESFNYILYKYPASNNINQAKVWREKTNIRLENDELAIKNLKRLLEQEELSGQDLADATSILAQAYINTKSLDSAITQIGIAAKATKSNDERGRYRFIQGQLYNALGDKDSANIAFDRVIDLNRSTPRMYLISAHIEKAKNFDYNQGNKLEFFELLTDLEENRENRPYLDKIYHQIAEYHVKNNSDSLALVYYNKSLRTDSNDKVLKAKNYEIIGDMKFDVAEYKDAGDYYDSTMTNMVQNSKPYRVIKRKRDNLEDVIYYEDIAKNNDSILQLVALPKEAKIAYFEEYIEKLKIAAEKEQERLEAAEKNKELVSVNNNFGNSTSGLIGVKGSSGGPMSGQGSSFYFYNTTTVAYGKSEFTKNWGNRKLQDDWRWSNSIKSAISTTETNTAITNASNEELYDPHFYIAQIPSEEKVVDSIAKERNFAYYQLGLIYKEKFKEYSLAITNFTQLLDNNPEENLILPSKYNLYKIYQLLGEETEANFIKEDIITTYPDSRYATILNNPEAANLEDKNSPETIYKNLYNQFTNQEYAKVLSNIDTYITAFEAEDIVSKFELLKATTTGRLYGYEAYSKAINFVALNYANTPEGKQAQNLVSTALPKLSKKVFVSDTLKGNYKVLYKFNATDTEEITSFVKTLNEVNSNISHYDLSTSVDVYDPETIFVVVHGLKSIDGAKGFAFILRDEDRYKITKPSIAISSQNYQIVQIHKNVEDYIKEYQ